MIIIKINKHRADLSRLAVEQKQKRYTCIVKKYCKIMLVFNLAYAVFSIWHFSIAFAEAEGQSH